MIIATVKTLTAGYRMEQEEVQKLGWKIGDKFEVKSISVGGYSSTITFPDGKQYNSCFFDFEENGMELEIMSDPRFNNYARFYLPQQEDIEAKDASNECSDD